MEAKDCVIKNTLIKVIVFLQGKDTINIGFSFVNNELFQYQKKKLMLTFGIKYHFHICLIFKRLLKGH